MDRESEGLQNAFLSLLQDVSPAEAARRAVHGFSRGLGCSCVAAFREDEGEMKLLSGTGADQAAIDAVNDAWRVSRRRLVAGERIHDASSVLVPLMAEGQVAGLLYLRSEDIRPAIPLEPFAPAFSILARVCRAPADGPTFTVADMPMEDVERIRLIDCLDQHEWNLARVARAMGVTRPTIYHWMDRLGIERKHVRQPSGYAARKRT